MKKNNFLDYDELTKSYNDQLNNKLRDFGTEHLKLWVPEENIVKSILNLISSAIIHNKIIDIRVSKDTLNKKKLKKILNYSPNFSNIKITYEKNSYLLNYKKINSTELNKIIIFFSKKKNMKKVLILKKRSHQKKLLKLIKKS